MIFRKKSKELITKSTLRIYVDKSVCVSGHFEYSFRINQTDNEIKPWLRFIKWFHYRGQSRYYVIRHNDGLQTFDRETIVSFSIKKTMHYSKK